MTPTYYVQHPDGSYSVADPQPQQDAQAVPQHLADDERVAALCDLSYVAGMKAGWNFCVSDDSDRFERRQNSVGEAIRILKAHRAAPTPPAQRVMLTDEEIAALPVWTHFVGLMTDSKSDIACAVIEAYERKNGISQPGYTAPDMASQGASPFSAGHDAAQSEIAELEQENRLLRARNDRLQKEIEQKGER